MRKGKHPGPYLDTPAASIAWSKGLGNHQALLCLFWTGLPEAEEISL